MSVPMIPNLPVFFCVWCSWSQHRAYKSSQYLDAFLQQGAIVPEASPQPDVIYAKYAPRVAESTDATAKSEKSLPSPESEEDASAPSTGPESAVDEGGGAGAPEDA